MDDLKPLINRRAQRLSSIMQYPIDEAIRLASMTYGVDTTHSNNIKSNSLPPRKTRDNKILLAQLGIESAIFFPTKTGLEKFILDATQPIRTLFEIEEYHYYCHQNQGDENKIITNAFFLSDDAIISSQASLYRPKTKKGDPRMWFRGLPNFAQPGDQIAIIIYDKVPYLLNLSNTDIEASLSKECSHIKAFFSNLEHQNNSVADELLEKLKVLAKTPFASMRTGDTGIGFTIEEKLGIKANSSKQPDYKGIELKSGRVAKSGQGTRSKTRTTLFAQVADWRISPCKSSAEILNKYGYERGDEFKLNCIVSTKRENPQGLRFFYDPTKDELQEWHNGAELVAVWPGDLLRNRLKEKHAETFWIEATSEVVGEIEYFQLRRVTHTRSPVVSQFMPLIEAGVITMDHLIKKNEKGRVSEKGPLFKIYKGDLERLFPKLETHELVCS
ncbi:MvaI/BcnI family restriction endonuclease [Vibrio rotiferianus]|uniref:MvaI/BcnI family restriction endonuclease n=1 Tax=Vibrio rotiferianus TaxID=190895 RepID=UPI0002374F24|nr:MvaI/BcnI family restriction endonuclease [Vibrio rotiferianus]